LLAKPSMSMEAVNRAITDLMAAIDLSEQSNRRIIDSCNDYTNKMTTINTQLANRLGHGADAAPALPSSPAESELTKLLS